MLKLLVPVAALWLSGCATITTGSSQTLTLDTQPPGAACIFRREGAVIGAVNPTPGSIAVDKSYRDIEIRCNKPGHLEASGRIGSSFQAMTFGNILFGGLIGLVVDASSGASAQYEPAITIVLVPSRFESLAARDAFFDARRANFQQQAAEVRTRIQARCRGLECEQQLDAARRAEAADLARIEDERRSALIEPRP